METVRQFINPMLETLGTKLPDILGALLIFTLGLIVAVLIRKGLTKLLEKFKLDERVENKTGKSLKVESFISSLIYYIILLMVLLLTLEILGIQGVLDPLVNLSNNLLDVLPNIVAAGLIGFAGYLIAKIVSSAVGVLAKGLDSLSTKMGLGEKFSISNLVEQIVFILIFVPILISALDALKIEAISIPSTEMLAALLAAIPKILAAGLIIGVAYVVGKFVTTIVSELLLNLGADSVPEKIGIGGAFGEAKSFSRFCGGILFFFILLAASVSAIDKLDMPQLSKILGELLVFAGQVALGIVILSLGNFLANLAYKALSQSADNMVLASLARLALLGLVLAMGLRAMGIADDIVNLAFGLTLGAVAVAAALAFGLGGREAAGKQMEYWLAKLRREE